MAAADETIANIPLEELPTWMRQARQGTDWGVLMAVIFSLAFAWSFLLRDGLSHTNAMENHLFMAADYSQAFREGRLYPRWTAAALNGYGAPIPNYFPPGAPYSVAAVELLFTNDTVTAMRLVLVLSLVLAGAMTYVFVMRWAGAGAALLACVLYVCSPFVGFTASFVLGDLPVVMCLGLLPALLWAVNRLLLLNRVFDFALVSLIASALILTDVRFALVGACLTVSLLVWYGATKPRKRRISLVLLAGVLGVLMASFYWMPALLEQEYVTWQPPPYEPLPYVLDLSTFFAPARKVDLNALLPSPQLSMGIGTLILAAGGLLVGLRQRKLHTLYAIFLLDGFVLSFVALVLLPRETWLLCPISLCLAIVGGAAFSLRDWLPATYRHLLLPVLLVAVLALAIPVWLPPLYPGAVSSATQSDQIAYEQQGYGVAVLPPGSSVPVTIRSNLEPNLSLINGYQAGQPVRLPQSQLGVGKQANLLRAESHEDRYLISTNAGAEFALLRAYFPGWQAETGAERIGITVDEQTGLIRLQVPPTVNNTVSITLNATPARRTAWMLSWAMLVLVLLDVLRRLRWQSGDVYDNRRLLPQADARLVLVVLVGFLPAVWLFARPESPYSLHARPGYELDNSMAVRSRTGVGLELLSYRPDDRVYRIGDTVSFTLYWRTVRTLLRNYSVQVSLRDTRQGIHWLQSAPRYPGGYPTRRWANNQYVDDPHEIFLSAGISPGEYQIAVEVFDCNPDCDLGTRLNFYDETGQLIGPVLTLPQRLTIGS